MLNKTNNVQVWPQGEVSYEWLCPACRVSCVSVSQFLVASRAHGFDGTVVVSNIIIERHLFSHGVAVTVGLLHFRYYNSRRSGDVMDDPRMKLFQREWFEGKHVLDIGCNSGELTIELARTFRATKVGRYPCLSLALPGRVLRAPLALPKKWPEAWRLPVFLARVQSQRMCTRVKCTGR